MIAKFIRSFQVLWLFIAIGVLSTITAAARQGKEVDKGHQFLQLSDAKKVDYVIDNFYAIYSDDFAKALSFTKQATAIAHQNHWKSKEGYCLMYQGVVNFLIGNYDRALPLYLGANHLFDSLADFNGLARLNNEMTSFYSKQSDLKNVFKVIDAAELYSKKAGNLSELATSYGNRGTFLFREKKIAEAADYYKKVYAIRVEQKDSVGLSYVMLDLSSLALEDGNLEVALNYIRQSTAIREKLGDKQGVIVNLINTGEAYQAVHDYKRAIPLFKQCLERAIPLGYTDLIRYTYDQMSFSYRQLQDYKSAYEFQQKSHAFKDSLYNIDKAKAIAGFQERYESEKKERELSEQHALLAMNGEALERSKFHVVLLASAILIVLIAATMLWQYQTSKRIKLEQAAAFQLELADVRLRSELQQDRLRISRELHDNIGSRLLFISTAADNLTSSSPVSSAEKVEQMGSFARTTLEELRRTVWLINRDSIPMEEFQLKLLEYFSFLKQSTSIPISVGCEADDNIMLRSSAAATIFRIAQEAISNAIKHARASSIAIQLTSPGSHQILLVVTDNGEGFDETLLTSGNGLKNMNSHAESNGGKLEISSAWGKGTSVALSLPV